MCYYTYSSLTYKDIIHKTLNNWIFLCFFIKKEYTILNKLLTNKKKYLTRFFLYKNAVYE